MTSVNTLLAERLAFLATVTPTVTTVVTGQSITSSYVQITATNANLFGRIAGLAVVAATANTGTITASLVKASDTNGTGVTTVVNATAVATASANIPLLVELNLDGPNASFTDTTNVYYAVKVTSPGAGTVAGVMVGVDACYQPASTYNTALTATGQG